MEQKYLTLKCQSNAKKEKILFLYIRTISAVVKLISLFIGLFSKLPVFTHQQSDQKSFYRYTTFHFILQTVLIHNHLMSTKKQISRLCKLYSVYDEKPEKFLDETDVDSCFYHNFLDISQSQHRIVRVSKGSNKKSFAFKVFHFAIQNCSSDLLSRKKLAIPKTTESLLDSLGEILKAFDQANKVSQIPLPKPKIEIGFTKAKDELFRHCYEKIAEHLNRQYRFLFRFEKNKTCVFSVKKFEHYGDQFIFTEVVKPGYREMKHLYRNQFFVAYKCDIFQSNYDV